MSQQGREQAICEGVTQCDPEIRKTLPKRQSQPDLGRLHTSYAGAGSLSNNDTRIE